MDLDVDGDDLTTSPHGSAREVKDAYGYEIRIMSSTLTLPNDGSQLNG